MRSRSLILIIAAIFWLLTTLPHSANAQSRLEITRISVSYIFGHHIAFEADISTSEQIVKVEILFREEGAEDTVIVDAELDSNQTALGVYEFSQGRAIKAFTKVSYWFRVTLEDEEILESGRFEFTYTDNRFEWIKLADSTFQVYTHEDDTVLAKEILNAARNLLEKSTDLLDLPAVEDINIYVYTNAEDLHYALNLSGQFWIAGHADPGLGVALVSIQPGPEQSLEIGRQIPHEIAHLLLYQTLGDGYANLPTWLNEGFASHIERVPNIDYLRSVQQARESGSLIPLSDLCTSFPTDAASAGLAYAQSASFVNYLYEESGPDAIKSLLTDYASGLSCEHGTTAVFGSSLSQLERAWKDTLLPGNNASSILADAITWLTMIVLILASPTVVIILSNLRRRRERAGDD
ncbi:MAG: hypothetical protein IH859_01485 [Chloroflexi bacterium]|nr:hypothetical protein [Chloroflexota bacterium]